MSVSTQPGLIPFTRTPWGRSERPSDAVYPTTPHLDTAYPPSSASAWRPDEEPMLMITPLPRSTMWGATAWQHRNTPRRLTSIMVSHCSTVVDQTGVS